MKKWTIILQMSAENNLYLDMTQGFDKIGLCEISKEINFIILFDGLKNDLHPDELQYPCVYEMKKGMKYGISAPHKNFGKDFDDLTDEKNLTDILKYIKKEFEAEHYGYIYSGHGGAGEGDISTGSFRTSIDRILPGERDENGDVIDELVEKRLTIPFWSYAGYCELEGNKDIILVVYSRGTASLTYKGLNKRLDIAFQGKGLSFVFLDTCWGMMMENCYTYKDTTDHFVATVDEMPATGVGYNDLINLLNKRPLIKPHELAKLFVAVNYVNNYADYACGRVEFEKMGISMTCIDTNKIDDLIDDYFDPFCAHLIANMERLFVVFKRATEKCLDYTYVDYSEPGHDDYGVYNIDMIWFLENILYYNTKLAPSGKVIDRDLQVLAHKLIQRITLNLYKSAMSNNYPEPPLGTEPAIGGRGLAITLPKDAKQLENSIYYKNPGASNFVKVTLWKKLIKAYIGRIKNLQDQIKTDELGFFKKYWAAITEDEHFSKAFNYRVENNDKEMYDKQIYDQYKAFIHSADRFNLQQKWGPLKIPG